MKSLKSAARRGALVTVAAGSALALAACSAGQITQTSSQVAAVDGAEAETADNTIAVRDVTVHITPEGETGLKFAAVNQDTLEKTHTLKSITVGGEAVTLSQPVVLEPACTVVADIPSEMAKLTEPDNMCITHVTTSLTNTGLAAGGNKDVVFTFDTGTIELTSTISEPVPASGHNVRESSTDTGAH